MHWSCSSFFSLVACIALACTTHAELSLRIDLPKEKLASLSKKDNPSLRMYKLPSERNSQEESDLDETRTQQTTGLARPLFLPASRAMPSEADVVLSGDTVLTLTTCVRQLGSVYCSFCGDVQNGGTQLTGDKRFGLNQSQYDIEMIRRLVFPCLRCPHGYLLTDYQQPNRESLKEALKRGHSGQSSNVTEMVFADSQPSGKCRRHSDAKSPERQYILHNAFVVAENIQSFVLNHSQSVPTTQMYRKLKFYNSSDCDMSETVHRTLGARVPINLQCELKPGSEYCDDCPYIVNGAFNKAEVPPRRPKSWCSTTSMVRCVKCPPGYILKNFMPIGRVHNLTVSHTTHGPVLGADCVKLFFTSAITLESILVTLIIVFSFLGGVVLVVLFLLWFSTKRRERRQRGTVNYVRQA